MKKLLVIGALIFSFVSSYGQEAIRRFDILSANLGLNKSTSIEVLRIDVSAPIYKNILTDVDLTIKGYTSKSKFNSRGSFGVGYALANEEGKIIGIVGQIGFSQGNDDDLKVYESDKGQTTIGGKFFINLDHNQTYLSASFKRALKDENYTVFEANAATGITKYLRAEGEYYTRSGENSLSEVFEDTSAKISMVFHMPDYAKSGVGLAAGPYVEFAKNSFLGSSTNAGVTLRLGLGGARRN